MLPSSTRLNSKQAYKPAADVEPRYKAEEQQRRLGVKYEREKWFSGLARFYSSYPVGADWSNGRPGGPVSGSSLVKQEGSKRKLRGAEPVAKMKTTVSRSERVWRRGNPDEQAEKHRRVADRRNFQTKQPLRTVVPQDETQLIITLNRKRRIDNLENVNLQDTGVELLDQWLDENDDWTDDGLEDLAQGDDVESRNYLLGDDYVIL